MAKSALIIGGGGQIGQATARRLLEEGWRVRLAQRTGARLPPDLAAEVDTIAVDREAEGGIERAVGAGADALIDCVAFDDGHAAQLLAVQEDVGGFVVISSGSVYRDDAGRTLDEAAQNGFPAYPPLITEDQPTVAPGPATYSTKKAALEQAMLAGARRPITILRPFAIHGPGSNHVREWWFAKRFLDGRRRIPLAWRGESRFHTTATVNIAALILTALSVPGTRVLNSADPEAPTVAEIGKAIGAVYGVEPDFVLIDGRPVGGVGGTPWSTPAPVVASGARAEALGYRPAATYAGAAPAACRSAEAYAAAGGRFIRYIEAMFDYAAEDGFMAGPA